MLPILYLHGFASSPSSRKASFFRDRLERAGANVVVPDLAEGDFEHLTITRQLAVIDRAAPPRPFRLLGSSMGGWLAALYAARHPQVERLALLAPAFAFNQRWPEHLGPAGMERWRREDALGVYHYGEGANRTLRYALMEDAARYEDFPDFAQPALIVHGIHDDVVPARGSEQFAAAHPNATLHLVDSGHDLLDVLDSIAPEILGFLTA